MLIHADALRFVDAPLSAAWTARLIVVRVALTAVFVGLGMSDDGVEGQGGHADNHGGQEDRDPFDVQEVTQRKSRTVIA
jgi:hypothetical protein